MKEAGIGSRKADVISASIRYFPDEGRQHRLATFRACRARLRIGDVEKLLIFTLDGVAALEAKKILGKLSTKIIAVSFPPHSAPSRADPQKSIQAGILGPIIQRLHRSGITIVQGTMPLREIAIPNHRDVKIEAIRRTLGMISGGLELCVQAVMMACDAGHVQTGERVVSCSADTAITARAAFSTALLTGFEIQEIICKPRYLTITKRNLYGSQPSSGSVT